MFRRHVLAVVGSILASTPTVLAQSGDSYLFTVDTVHTSVRFALETSANGACLPLIDDSCPLTGGLSVDLHAGVLPIETARFHDGDVSCASHLLAFVPNALPSLPPLLEIDVESLRLAPNSPDFALLTDGSFVLNDGFHVLDGALKLKPLGLRAITVPLVGLTTDVARTHGRIDIQSNGIHVTREIGNALLVDVPILNLQVRLSLRGVVEAQCHYPAATESCATTPNHVGPGALLDLSGTVSVSRDDLFLGCHGCPANCRAIGILGSLHASVPFGSGTLCIGGPLRRLGSLGVTLGGDGLVAVHLGALGVQVGTTRIVQVVYRDGTVLDLSNALELLACP